MPFSENFNEKIGPHERNQNKYNFMNEDIT